MSNFEQETYHDKTLNIFAEHAYKKMATKRYGVKFCCGTTEQLVFEQEKAERKMQLLKLNVIADPADAIASLVSGTSLVSEGIEPVPIIPDFNPLTVLNEFVIDAKQITLANEGNIVPNDLVYYWHSSVKSNAVNQKTLIFQPEYLQDKIYFAGGKSLELIKDIEFIDGQPFCCQFVISRTLDSTTHTLALGLNIFFINQGGGISHDTLARTYLFNTIDEIVLSNAIGAGVIKLAGERQILTLTRDSNNIIRFWQNTTEILNTAATFGGTILFTRLGTRHGSYLADNMYYAGIGNFLPTDEQRTNLINSQISKFDIII